MTIKLKTVEFELKTRGKTVANLTNQQSIIYAAARELLRTEIQACEPQPLKLRLMGKLIFVTNLSLFTSRISCILILVIIYISILASRSDLV